MNSAPAEPIDLAGIGTNALIAELRIRGDLSLAIREAARDLDSYRRALTEHHNMATLADSVIAAYDFRGCPVCARSRRA